QLIGFDPANGWYVESPAIAAKNYSFGPAVEGESRIVEYAFEPPTADAAVYSVNVIVRDDTVANKRALAGHRIVQFVTPDRPDATVFLEGFVRAVDARYAPGSIAVDAHVQLQQALLTPYIRV